MNFTTGSICLALLSSIKVYNFTPANMKGWNTNDFVRTKVSWIDDQIFLAMVLRIVRESSAIIMMNK